MHGKRVEWEQYLTPDFGSRFTSRENLGDPKLPPTPVKLINPVVLSCIDDMFYRLPFPSLDDLDRLIKEAGPSAETNMMEFRQGVREELNEPRALDDFAKGWATYWKETRPLTSPGSTPVGVNRSWAARNRSPSASEAEEEEEGGNDGGETEGGK